MTRLRRSVTQLRMFFSNFIWFFYYVICLQWLRICLKIHLCIYLLTDLSLLSVQRMQRVFIIFFNSWCLCCICPYRYSSDESNIHITLLLLMGIVFLAMHGESKNCTVVTEDESCAITLHTKKNYNFQKRFTAFVHVY